MSEKLGIHLLHKHWDIRPGEMIYGMNHKDTISMWLTRPVLVADVPLQEVRGYNFCLLQDGNVAPYEFRRRETTVDVDPHFLEEFSDYVKENRLENILGLQVKAEHMEEMTEIVFTTWNVMLERKHVANRCEWIPTGWTADEGIHSMTAHETHALIDGKHHPVNKGAPRTIWEVESSMRNLDFLKV